MKKVLLVLAALLMVSSNGFSEEMKAKTVKKMPMPFQAVSAGKAVILQKGDTKMFCPRCGMTLPMFYKTNHAATVNGKTEQYCAIHCLAETIAAGAKVTDIKVVDNTTLKFVDAKTAWYVFGSSKPGTMSMTSKYAFAKKADADTFAKEFGGKVMNFEDTLASVQSTLSKETEMIHKKQGMMTKKGEMLYQKMCTPFAETFHSVAEAKAYLTEKKPCGDLKGRQLQAIALYLTKRSK